MNYLKRLNAGEIPKTLVCTVCKKRKPLKSYFKFKRTKFGVYSECKPCFNLRNLKRNAEGRNQKYYASLTKEQREVRSARYRAKSREYYLKNIKKNKARAEVMKAIRNGILVRPAKCERCGLGKPQAHHYKGYAKKHALDVLWLCQPCHFKEHQSYRAISAKEEKV